MSPKITIERIPLPCPGCEFENSVSLDDISIEKTIICQGCGAEINIKDENKGARKIQRELDKIDRALRDLERAFRR